ncbi:MAG TPA: hypothetical protein VEF90_12705 [Xanthobacteraceae bacterium]|nr:hypothetical protein [Xanthobacteraceae bacterium]
MHAANLSAFAALAVALGLSGCATTSPQTVASTYTSAPPAPDAAASGPQRDLTPEEKKVIIDAVATSLRDPKSAKYRWAKFPMIVTEDSVNYCALVNAKSPHAAYDGEQAYIVEARVVGGHVSSAVIGLIAGGKDRALIATMCAKYGLDPNKSS